MKHSLFPLILLLFIVSSAPAQEGSKGVFVEGTDKKYAILIGVNDYVRMVKLRFIKNDIEALRDEFYKIGFEKENVYCFTSGSAETPLENTMKSRDRTAIINCLRSVGGR